MTNNPKTSSDPILGEWELLNYQYEFTDSGRVLMYGDPIALWQYLGGRKYMFAYLRGCAWRGRGASDIVEIVKGDDGVFTLPGFFSDWTDWDLNLKRADDVTDPHSIVGSWESGGNSLFDFTDDGWIELCGAPVGIWRRESETKFLCAYLGGHLRGVSEGLVLDEGLETGRMTYGDWRQKSIRRADARAMSQPTSPFDNAIVRLGTIELDVNLGPIGADDSRHRIFVAFDETFPDDRLENVAVIINNRSLPTAVPDATVAMHEGQQGFWLRVTNTLRVTDERDASQAAVSGKLVLSWIAVLGNAEPHELSNGKEFEVCTGKLPPQPVERYSMVEWPPDYTDLFGEQFQQCELPQIFFTSTHSGNAAMNCVARVSRSGIEDLTGYNTESQATNKASLFWVAIAKRNTPVESVGSGARNLWINCGVSHLVRHHSRAATAGDWSNYHRPFKPFFTEPPHTIMTGSGLNVEGHHACIVGLAFHQELKSGNMKARSCDAELAGQSGVSWIAFGPAAIQVGSADERTDYRVETKPKIEKVEKGRAQLLAEENSETNVFTDRFEGAELSEQWRCRSELYGERREVGQPMRHLAPIAVEDGVLTLAPINSNQLVTLRQNFTNFVLTVDLRILHHLAGIIVRWNSPREYYMVQVGIPWGDQAAEKVGGWHAFSSHVDGRLHHENMLEGKRLVENKWYRLRLKVEGYRFMLSVHALNDDDTIGEAWIELDWEDPNELFDSGAVGFWEDAERHQQGDHAEFRNLEVRPLEK